MAGEATTTVFTARRVITMDPTLPMRPRSPCPGRIAAVGQVDELRSAGASTTPSPTRCICPGLIDQHLHPLLGATTLMTEVIAIEDWVLPDQTYPAASSPQEYRHRLTAAEQALTDPDEWLFSWGYHKLWHGPLDRAALDAISTYPADRGVAALVSRVVPQHRGDRRARADRRSRWPATARPATWWTSPPGTGGKPA